jgi:hypothetical protein
LRLRPGVRQQKNLGLAQYELLRRFSGVANKKILGFSQDELPRRFSRVIVPNKSGL